MEIITTYGDTVYNDGTIKKQMVYEFTDTNSMVSMWYERDTSTDIEWTMSLDKLTITGVDYVVFGTDVGVVQVDRHISSAGNEVSDEEIVRRYGKADKIQEKWEAIQEQFRPSEEYTNAVERTIDMMIHSIPKNAKDFDKFRTSTLILFREFHI